VARDFWLGKSNKNFAIQGHPPAGSYQYDFIRGLPETRAPALPRKEPAPPLKNKKSSAKAVYDSLGSVATVSDTDFDAACRWMTNLAEQVTAKGNKKFLAGSDLDAWADLWKRWLLLGSKVKTDNTPATLKSLPSSPLMISALPLLYMARKLSSGVMREETKREYDDLLREAFGLYTSFRLKGLGQVAIPYMSDIVVMLKTLPGYLTLKEMVVRLREAARAADRLLDENTVWWQWKTRGDTGGLRRAIGAALDLADKFEKTSKIKGQEGGREKGSFAYDLFLAALTKMPIEAAALYQIEESIKAIQEKTTLPNGQEQPRNPKADLMTLGIFGVLGYISYKWWTKPQTKIIVESFKPGYYPDMADEDEDVFQHERDEES
jgi:hypothetical protein